MLITAILRKLRALGVRRHMQHVGGVGDEPSLAQGLDDNVARFRRDLGDSGDVVFREFLVGPPYRLRCVLIYIDGLVQELSLIEGILTPLQGSGWTREKGEEGVCALDEIRRAMLCCGDVSRSRDIGSLLTDCLSGHTILLAQGFDSGLSINTRGWDKRAILEPHSETVVRGPREGFTENLRTNTALIRRRIRSPQLSMVSRVVGRRTLTDVCVAYLRDVANPQVVKTVLERLDRLHIDGVMDSGSIENYIEDTPWSIFGTVGHTEKPDVAASRVLEGRVALIVDGSPFVLTVPMLFIESFQTAEDYYTRTLYASMVRLLRYACFFISVFAPAIYIALTTYHQELLPTTLLFTVANAQAGTPFSAFFETVIMVFAFEVLREAGLRLPRPVGQAISIVGALIMGDAAVSAGLVGAPMVITIAITAVSSFAVPSQNDSASLLRLIMMALALVLGGFGVAMGFLGILVHLASLRSFGVPFFEGLTPSRDQQDTFVRMPLSAMKDRPKDIAQGDEQRRDPFLPPNPPFAFAPQDGQSRRNRP